MAVKRIDEYHVGDDVITTPPKPTHQQRRGKVVAGIAGIAGAAGGLQSAIKSTGVATSTQDLQDEAARVLGEALGGD